MADLLQFTCKLTNNVRIRVDKLFDVLTDDIKVGQDELDCIKVIDGTEPV